MSIFGLFGKPNIEKLKAKRDVNGLIEALGYEKDEDIRKNAALALGDLDDSAAIDPLITALQDTYDVKVGVMQALAKMSHTRVLDYLMESLRNPNDRIQITAVEILNLKGWDPGMNEDGAFYWALRGNFRECLARGHLAVVPLIQLLNKEDFLIRRKEDLLSRRDIAETLGQIGDIRAVEPLIQLLQHEDLVIASFDYHQNYENRKKQIDAEEEHGLHLVILDRVIVALGQLGDVQAVKSLIGLLPKHPIFSQQVIAALVKLGTGAVESLIPLLNDEEWTIYTGVAKALGQIGDARAVEPLISQLKAETDDGSGSIDVRNGSIAKALGQIGDVRAVEPLIALLKYRNLSIDDIAMALGLIGDVRAVEPLIPLLKDGNSYLRQAVIVALGQIGDARAVTSLIPLLQDANHNVRIDVVVALGQIGDAQAVEPLIPLLKDYASKSIPHHLDKRVCDFVADTLRIIGTLEAQNALLNAGFDIA